MMENKKIISVREGEDEESPYRSGRFYSIENKWYYSVREKEDQGPFISKLTAENSLKTYIMDCEHFSVKKLSLI